MHLIFLKTMALCKYVIWVSDNTGRSILTDPLTNQPYIYDGPWQADQALARLETLRDGFLYRKAPLPYDRETSFKLF